MSTEKPIAKLPSTFDQNPELKKRLEEFLDSLPEEKKQRNIELVTKFLAGELSWAEVKDIPQALLKTLSTVAYQKFKEGDLKMAEILFKGLAVLDHHNWYYRSGLGAVYQKMGLIDQALAEYTMALQIHEDEPTCLLNRGICLMKQKDYDSALEDFNQILSLGLEESSPLAKRARALSQAILAIET